MFEISTPSKHALVLVHPEAAGHEEFVTDFLKERALELVGSVTVWPDTDSLQLMYPYHHPNNDPKGWLEIHSHFAGQRLTVFLFRALHLTGQVATHAATMVGTHRNPWLCPDESLRKALVREFPESYPPVTFPTDPEGYHRNLVSAPPKTIDIMDILEGLNSLKRRNVRTVAT